MSPKHTASIETVKAVLAGQATKLQLKERKHPPGETNTEGPKAGEAEPPQNSATTAANLWYGG